MRSGVRACWAIVVAVVGVLAAPGGGVAFGQTIVGGLIDQDTTWTLAQSPYLATETVALIGGAVLTIEPGVEVAFEAGTAMDASLGVLIADGQGGDPIVLRSASGVVGGWQGVISSLDVPAVTTPEGDYVGGPIFRNVAISEAVRAVEVGPEPIYLEAVEIERCSEAGVYFSFFLEDATMWLKGVTIRQAGVGVQFRGGLSARLMLHDCVLEDNTAGGLRMAAGSPGRGVLLRCVFRRNGVGGSRVAGGGAALHGGWDLIGCVFEANEANDTSLGGGGLRLDPSLPCTLTDCDFISNTSRRAGGGANVRQQARFGTESLVRFERCRFIGNTSSLSSGAGLLVENAFVPSLVEILDCTFADNRGDLNGGLALSVWNGVVAGNAFERNSGGASGGAIRLFGSFTPERLVIRGNAFVENTSDASGGAIDLSNRTVRDLRMESNAFERNVADTGGAIGGIVLALTTEIVGNAFEGNTARLGGAVHIANGSATGTTLAAEGDLRNRFIGNAADLGADIYNNTRDAIDAAGNCWGTDDLTAIAGRIFDASDDPTRGVVAFEPIATECDACPADLDADGALTIFDFLAFQNLFDAMDPRADFDGDGAFTIFDFLAFQNAFDAGC
ncbi:MAG: GC-type dockerin domain-anchored protein [Phycisphaerales bacterium JB060]